MRTFKNSIINTSQHPRDVRHGINGIFPGNVFAHIKDQYVSCPSEAALGEALAYPFFGETRALVKDFDKQKS